MKLHHRRRMGEALETTNGEYPIDTVKRVQVKKSASGKKKKTAKKKK